MGLADDLFNALLFGSGAWFGLIIIIAIALLIAITVKYSGVIFVLLLVFLGWEHFTRITDSSMSFWFALMNWGAAAFAMSIFVNDMIGDRKK